MSGIAARSIARSVPIFDLEVIITSFERMTLETVQEIEIDFIITLGYALYFLYL
jgi:hypothetical protein